MYTKTHLLSGSQAIKKTETPLGNALTGALLMSRFHNFAASLTTKLINKSIPN